MKHDEIIKSWMENYPEAGRGTCLKCLGWNYDKMRFAFLDEEEDKMHEVNMRMLRKGFKILLESKPGIIAKDYDSDADDYDSLVQYAIFGEIIYG